MAGRLYTLIFIIIGLVSSAWAVDTGSCNLETVQDILETLVSEMEDIKQDQEDLKKHTLKRLEALDEKTEWCLSSGQQGAHPLDERMTKIEQILASPKDCEDVYDQGFTESGDYMISPKPFKKIEVYCEQELDGGGWTVFQHRQDGSVHFYRNWNDYKTGFGNLTGEFWLGNDNLRLLTKDHDQKLKIELISPDGEVAYADYSTFWIDNEDLKYKLHVSGFSGANPPGDSLAYHNQSNFSTKDRDNDRWSGNCAKSNTGAWWYKGCQHSNLNGAYGSIIGGTGVNWKTWRGYQVSMRGTKMMIKTKP